MCDFHTLSDEEKNLFHQKLLDCANNFGGKNLFLHLLEAIRETKPHPLVSPNSTFNIELGSITWNKVIFNDKLQILLKARVNEGKQNNILPDENAKNYKKILNLLRTLRPIVFHVKPANKEDGAGFFFQPFDIIDSDTTKLNPIFDAIFFCSVDTIKKALNYVPNN
ncbi:MAG TPA: hypothetical protein EYG82_02380 [Sulfurovum sp.]|nr:hypothetical protein [Sulfurovum sp.]